MLDHYLLDTPAWKHLTPNARAVYIELKRRYNGSNNGHLAMGSREAARTLNASSNKTGARALEELIDHGFIAITERSSFTRKVHIATEYRLTEARDDRPGLEAAPTKEFMRWRPATEPPPKSKHSVIGVRHSVTHDTEEKKGRQIHA